MPASAINTAVFVAGGTGGHLYPGIAAAHAVVKNGGTAKTWKAVFIVRRGDIGRALIQREGFEVFEISGQGFPRRLTKQLLKFPFVLAAGFKEAWSVLGRLKPKVVVGMGGYLSFPVLMGARLRGIPTMIHEQNVHPGLSNRVLSRWVKSVAVSFDESRSAFPARKVWLSGLPVRPEIGTINAGEGRRRLRLDGSKFTVLVFGGSLGARRLNEAAAAAWPMLSEWAKEFQVIHVTGERDHAAISKLYKAQKLRSVVIPYCHDMAAALAAADFVVCRAGASTVAELIVARKPALLIPFPFASENHQFYNAEVLVKRGVGDMLLDNLVTPQRLAERVGLYLQYPERLETMREKLNGMASQAGHFQAAQKMAERITSLS